MELLAILLVWVIALVAMPRFTLAVTGIFTFIVVSGFFILIQL